MPDYNLIGQDFTPPDVRAKVTGRAKYAEDFRAEGMLFCRLLTSPMPHARVVAVDASEALAMEGVVAVLRADEVPAVDEPGNPILNDEPRYVGEPILAVAAESETLAHDALERIRIELEPLPFAVDPLHSLRPDGSDARMTGNTMDPVEGVRQVKWKEEDFGALEEGHLPLGQPVAEWSRGDVEAGFADAALVLDESFVVASTSHHSMEPRTAMAYWRNGKCYVHGSTQSQSFIMSGLARYIGIDVEDLVYVAEFCGGGFGSKGSAYPIMSVPAHMARKTGRPVMMRISRAEEHFIGVARCGFQGRIKMGFREDGRVAAVDLYIVQDNGPNSGFTDWHSAGDAVSLVYTPPAMRFRAVPVFTNTPPRGAQRGPGQNQIACAVEPLMDEAARRLGVDPVEIRRINAPDSDTRFGEENASVTSAFHREGLIRGAERFGWEERKARSGARSGSKVVGVGVGQAYHSAGSSGLDGLVRITPDGILHIHTGVGNLGTYSYAATSRVAAEVLGYDWDRCVIERGDSSRGLPFNLGQFGSNTSFTMSRTNYVAAMDAAEKLRAIAALELGGSADDYELRGEAVVGRDDTSRRLSFADAAARAVELGGRFSGEEYPDDLNDVTKHAVEMLAGTGLVGVARDGLERTGTPPALAAGFVEIELDLDTGMFEIVDYLGVADCGRVIHPQGLAAQVRGGAVMGFGMAVLEKHVYDPHIGLAGRVGLHQQKLPTYLDVPVEMDWMAVDEPDPQNPVGARGVGEPLMGCAAAALQNAISDALGGHVFNRTPITTDMIVNAAAGRQQSYGPVRTNA